MSSADIDTFLTWVTQEEAYDGCDVVVSRQGDETVTEVTVRLRDPKEVGTTVQIVFIDGAQDSDWVIRILPDGGNSRPIPEPVEDRCV